MASTKSENLHYIFALDDSGSMSGQKWRDLMNSFSISVEQLKKINLTSKNIKVSILI